MEYFNLLHFKKEPFSNSPEPEFLFAAEQYSSCLQMLELAVRLKRGLNVVIGDVGTGKTTLCRKLIQNLATPSSSDAPVIETFLLMDPAVENEIAFLKTVAEILGIKDIAGEDQEWHLKEKIKNFLFEKGVDEQKITVLIIDEGQKIPDNCLEILREFLNYETNKFKLLQIIIFAQPEFHKSLAAKANLLDRVNYLYHIKPMSFSQMKAMIAYRIFVARQESVLQHSLFTFGGLLAIYLHTSGYPRKVVSLCHQALLMMIIRGKNRAGWFLVRSCINRMVWKFYRRMKWVAAFIILVLLILSLGTLWYSNGLKGFADHFKKDLSISLAKETAVDPKRMINEKEKTLKGNLGAITIKRRITVWRILDNIYGDTGTDMMRQLIAANPEIKDINNTSEGSVIQLPALNQIAHPMKQDTIIVALAEGQVLEPIYYSFLENKDRSRMPLIFLSTRNQREGTRFFIALDKRFNRMEEANEAIQRLPAEAAGSARVLSQWDADTIVFNRRFFSN